jgi:hypothetical protein
MVNLHCIHLDPDVLPTGSNFNFQVDGAMRQLFEGKSSSIEGAARLLKNGAGWLGRGLADGGVNTLSFERILRRSLRLRPTSRSIFVCSAPLT